MLFSKEQALHTVIRHYNVLKDLLSFMMFRRNVGFDDIILLTKTDDETADGRGYTRTANVFIKRDEPLTEKRQFEGILFEEIEEALPAFLSVLYNDKIRSYLYVDGYLPDNDDSVLRMTNMRIREICSALECEMGLIQQGQTDENLEALINEVSDIVKKHRDGENPLPPKTYDNIFGSISHWSAAASDRIIALYKQYQEVITHIKPNRFGIFTDDAAIEAFIQYRNDITHGKFRILTTEIARTGYVLMGLVYCCVLKRIGLSEEQIRSLQCLPDLLL